LPCVDEFAEQLLLPWHRLGADDVGSRDRGPDSRLNAGFVPGALSAQPETQTGNLGSTRVDINAVNVVLDN
jgi:hypothetical protein